MPFIRRLFSRQTLAWASGGTVLAAAGGYWYLNSGPPYPLPTKETRRPPPPWTPPSRSQMLDALKASGKITTLGKASVESGEEFDLLVVGGGATGAGVAVDAATRGLKVAVIERDDFSAGTSSKSTKLVHGGVRYLQKAVFELDYEQYKLVKEALHERRIFLQTAPYLSAMLPIMLPIYKYWQVPYYWSGCKMYDILAGKENMESSYLMSKGKALETFPMLKSDGLVGAVVYYDGQHNDSRMNIALIMTAVKHGAVVANHCEVTALQKDSTTGKLNGATVRDNLTGASFNVRAKGIINATGPFSDTLLTLDNPSHRPIVRASSGVHITLPNYYSPRTMGLLDPHTSDGRVIFFLPWQGNTIAGTTDTAVSVTREPKAQEEEIRWVLDEVRSYLSPDIKVRRGDVLSAWSGLRPLVMNPNSTNAEGGTEGLVRNHMIHVSESGLLTIAGGKWTTYRAMSEETVDVAVKEFGLNATNGCITDRVRLVGSDGWSRNMFIGLIQRYGLETEVAKHLSDSYGDRAWTVCSLVQATGKRWPLHGIRLTPNYPYLEGEVRYAVRHEYALTPTDVLARRTRLSFLNVSAALEALPRVAEIMAEELGWSNKERKRHIKDTVYFLASMGLSPESGFRALEAQKTSWWRPAVSLWPWTLWRKQKKQKGGKSVPEYSRAQFEAGEVDSLLEAFESRAKLSDSTAFTKSPLTGVTEGSHTVSTAQLLQGVVQSIPTKYGYDGISAKDWKYATEEAGLEGKEELSFDEFVEICATVKEVSFTVDRSGKGERRRISVEKSGGGV